MHTVYTVGYAHWTPATLRAEALRLHAHIVDIRANPTSTRPEWRKSALLQSCQGWYGWEPCLGNTNDASGGPIVLKNPAQAVIHLTPWLQRQSLILLCQCPDYRTCHRLVAATYLQEHLGCDVAHLEPPVIPAPAGYRKCLTVRQPWAWALMTGIKDIENRTWPTSYRGPLAIHAAKTMTYREYTDAADFCAYNNVVLPAREALVLGSVLGTVDLMDCVTDS